ncbi:MAG: potassium/proton antiporter rosb [Labilithrix sp.]|nr:potassium/proton antiporter rosb [Labilithrix sp.]
MAGGDHDLLKSLAVVLGVAALTTIVARRLHQPVVLGYLVAGLLIGPHVPIPLVADPETVHTLSELGVVLLMFSIGLEFSLRKLFRVGASVAVTAVVECSLLLWLGFLAGRVFGWTTRESIFTGAVIAISSTTIVAKAFEEQKIARRLRELVFGVLVVEDLIAVLLMATLTALATGRGLSPMSLARTTARLGVFLVALVVVGLLLVPRAMRRITALGRPEATIVASVGLCFATALLARELGYSVALGAFIAGSLVGESGEEKSIALLVQPVRDVFAAVFFVSVGMTMNPVLMARHWVAIVVLTFVVITGKIIGVTLGAFLSGHGTRTSLQAGMSLAQIGEFSFIIAGLGLTLHATGDFLFPVAVAVSALTALLTPWLIRASAPVARMIDRALPAPLQTFVALYASWLERLRSSGAKSPSARVVRRFVRMLIIDASVVAAIIVASALGADSISAYLVANGVLTTDVARAFVLALAAALAVPFCIGIARVGRRLATTLAGMALPTTDAGSESLDLAAAPRRTLVVTLQLGIILLVGAPLMAITQPFLRGYQGAWLLLAIVLVLAFASWRAATNLQGHVRASAQVIVEALARQTHVPADGAVEVPLQLNALLEGLGEPRAIALASGSPAVGKTLAELNLRGVTGATVLAITRAGSQMLVPSSHAPLNEGDVLAVAGTREAVGAARRLLVG